MTGGGVVGWSKVGVCGRKEGACEVATTHPIFDQPLGGARKRFSSVLLARDAQIWRRRDCGVSVGAQAHTVRLGRRRRHRCRLILLLAVGEA